MKKTVLFSAVIILIAICAIIFICQSNDHKDCTITETTEVSEHGKTTVTTKKHSCNEKYNF